MNEYQTDPKVTIFCVRLEKLDMVGKAKLKRCAGQSLEEARQETVGLFYSLLPSGVPIHQENIYFLAATLFGMGKGREQGNFGETMRKVKAVKNKKGLDRRMTILLDSDSSQLRFRLRQVVQLLKSQQIAVDFPKLLDDLLWWGSEEHYVQRRWARAYFAENQSTRMK